MITKLRQNCLSEWPSQKIKNGERPVKKLIVEDRSTFPEGSCQKSPGSDLNWSYLGG